MNGFDPTLSLDMLETSCLRLSQALLHFLWQGFFIALPVWGATRWLRRKSAGTRYLVNATALALMAACLPITFALLPISTTDGPASGATPQTATIDPGEEANGTLATKTPAGETPATEESAGERTEAPAYPVERATETGLTPADKSTPVGEGGMAATNRDGPAGESIAQRARPGNADAAWYRPWAPYIAGAYLFGVIAMVFRVVRALWGGHRSRCESMPVDEAGLLETIRVQSLRIGLKAVPAVALCHRIATPAVVGILRPMILLPPSAITGLSVEELEALLIHELAHIRRYDLAVNLLQRLVEAVLFFHPAVWYVSRRLNIERENCCDDKVLSAGFPRLRYADALVRMAELCVGGRMASQAALAADAGKDPTELKQRVLRLLEAGPHDGPRRPFRSRLCLTRSGVVCLVALWAAIMLAPAAFEEWSGNGSSVEASQPEEPPLDRAAMLALAERDRFRVSTVVTLDPIHGTITGRGGRPVVGARVYLREHATSTQSACHEGPLSREGALTEQLAEAYQTFDCTTSRMRIRATLRRWRPPRRISRDNSVSWGLRARER